MPADLSASPFRLVGDDLEVPCLDGTPRRYVNLDNAASTAGHAGGVEGSARRSCPGTAACTAAAGAKSQVVHRGVRGRARRVARFVGARQTTTVVFVRNTTEAINVLAAALPAGTRVLSSPVEHHANMLPWRRHDIRSLPFTASADELLDACEHALRARGRGSTCSP